MSDDEFKKDLFKQAIREWLDEKYAEIGHWTVRTLLIAGIGWFIFEYIQARGFKLP